MSLNQGQQKVYDLIADGHNVFCMGVGGTGKSYLINKIREDFGSDTIFLSTTGISAMNIRGMTAHSGLSIPLGHPTRAELNKISKTTDRLFSKGKVTRIVIDEASMLTAGAMYAISQRLKAFNKRVRMKHQRDIQVIMFCDLGQLGAISNDEERKLALKDYKTDKFYRMRQFEDLNFKFCELTQVMRQEDEEMKKMLGLLREGRGMEVEKIVRGKKKKVRSLNPDVLGAIDWFNERCFKGAVNTEDSVILATTNNAVSKYNTIVYDKNPNHEMLYSAGVFGNFPKRDYPLEESVRLKEGLHVIILKNDMEGKYVNGSTGIVEFMDEEGVTVKLDNPLKPGHDLVFIEQNTWENRGYDVEENDEGEEELVQKILGTFAQIPLKQCSALSVHRSQGQTLDHAVYDPGFDAGWCEGLTYVACSRVKTIEGLRFKRKLRPSDVKSNWDALTWWDEVLEKQDTPDISEEENKPEDSLDLGVDIPVDLL
jgi:predicted ATPase